MAPLNFFIGTRGSVSGTSGTGYDIYTIAGNDLRFFTNGTNLALTIDTSQNATFEGDVGIGRTVGGSTTILDGTKTETGSTAVVARFTNDASGSYGSANGHFRLQIGSTSAAQYSPRIDFTDYDAWNGNLSCDKTNGMVFRVQAGVVNGLDPTSLAERMGITVAGAVEIKGTSTTTNAKAFITNTNTLMTLGSTQSAGVPKDMAFWNGAERVRIQATTGNVGIGTTTPGAKLSVQNTSTAVTSLLLGNNSGSTGDYQQIVFQYSQTDTSYRSAIRSRVQAGGVHGGNLSFWTDQNGTTTLTERMTIDRVGNVGIGTASPTSKLHLRDPGVNSDVGIKIGNDSRDWNLKVMGSVSDSFQIFTHDNSNVMTILPSGNVGIGAIAPSAKLEVAGGSTGIRLSNVGDQSAYDHVEMTYSGYNAGSPNFIFKPVTTPGSGNVNTQFLFANSNGTSATANNNANVSIDGVLDIGRSKYTGETTLILRNYDDTLVDTNEIQNSIRMSGRYWSGSTSQLVETRINSLHSDSNGNGGSALTFMTQTGGSLPRSIMYLGKNGNVRIGTTVSEPTIKLEVEGQLKHDGLVLETGTGAQIDTVTTHNVSLNLVAGNWVDTGIYSNSGSYQLEGSGTYVVQIYSDAHGGEPYFYSCYFSGIMSWYFGTSNQSATFDIPLTTATHSTNGRTLELRIQVTTAAGPGTPINNARLEVKCSASTTSSALSFRFRRLL